MKNNKKLAVNLTKTLTRYSNWLKRKDLASKTIQSYTEGVKHFHKFYGYNLTLTKLSQYFQEKVNKLAVNTIIGYKTALKSYAKWQKIKLNWERITKLIPKSQPKFFPTLDFNGLEQLKTTRTEVKNKTQQRNNLLLEFLFYTGLRLSELANLKHSDWQSNQLKILGKGNKVRYVFLPPHLVAYIKSNCTDYFFTNNQGNKLSLRTIQQIIHDKVKQSGINKTISAHSFRRSFATNLYNRGGKLETIQKQLGHSSLDTTMAYIHNDYDTLYQDYSKLWSEVRNA